MRRRLGHTMATTAHLAAIGVIGPVVLSLLLTLVLLVVGLVPVAGLGLLLFPVASGAIWAVVRFEESRVAGLDQLDLPARPMPRSPRTGWTRIPATLWLQLTDGANRRALAHLALASVLGLGTLIALYVALNGAMFAASGLFGTGSIYLAPWLDVQVTHTTAIVTGVLAFVAGIAAVYGLSRVHAGASVQLLKPSREAELTARAETATRRRQEAIRAAEVERTRIERDLHDGVQPRLVSVGMTLGMAKAKLATDPEAAAALIDEAHTSAKAAITELRQLARGIHPAVLSDRGLDPALSALAARSHIPVHLDVQLNRRCSEEAEAAMYFAVAETLTNAAKHSDAQFCRVTIGHRPAAATSPLARPGSDGVQPADPQPCSGVLHARIEDDGHGGARRIPGGGIDGIANRVAAAGGTFSFTSPACGPTIIEVSLPCGS